MSSLLARMGRSVRPLRSAVAAGAAVAVLAPAASAFGPADQQQPVQDATITLPPGIAQTFTVGRDGRLDGLTLTAATTGVINFQLYDLRADGTPDVTRPRLPQTASAALSAGVPADIGISPVDVKAGDRLALGIGTIRSTATIDLATGTGDRYPAGELFTVGGAFTFTSVPGVDLTFATHVTSPAPTQLSLRSLKSTGGHPTAVLTSGAAGTPVAGKVVTFRLLRSGGAVKDTCSATTDAAGTATCAAKRWSVPSGGSATATFAGDADYLPSSATTTS